MQPNPLAKKSSANSAIEIFKLKPVTPNLLVESRPPYFLSDETVKSFDGSRLAPDSSADYF